MPKQLQGAGVRFGLGKLKMCVSGLDTVFTVVFVGVIHKALKQIELTTLSAAAI